MGAEIDRLEIQIEAQASKANKQLDEMIARLGKTSSSLSGINIGSLSAIGSSANKSNGHLKNFTKTLADYTKTAISASRNTRSLSSRLGSFYANCFPLIRAFKALGKAVQSSMDYIETYNYYNVTMSKIASEFSNQWQKYGYDSAEAYGNSFTSRLNDLTQKMSGYKVGNNGVLTIAGGQNLSLDPEQIMQYQSNVAAITNSVGLVGETSINTAKALSMLAADMSSLKNIDMSTVMTNFQSGLIGQSRALYKYGIDITNATLQTYAYKYGVQTAVSEMTQADKMQLRLLAILDQSKVAWGDQANTLNSVANQYRILKQQIANLGRVIGNLLIPIVAKALPIINGITIALQRMFMFIGNLLGVDWSGLMDGISTGYSGDDSLEDLSDDSDGLGDSLDNTNKKAKKLQHTLMGFDELNVLSRPSEESDGNSSDKKGNAGSIDLSRAIAAALADYESVWNKALKNSQNKAQEYADQICGIFDKMWQMIKSGDYEGIGEYIAGGVDYLFEKINSVFNWDKLGPTITRFVDGYTRTINSLVDNIHWYDVGRSIGDGINVITNTLYLYLKGIDWVNIGAALATGLNGMIDGIDWDVLGRTVGAWVMKIPMIAYGFVTTLSWGELGTSIGNALNSAISEIDLGMIGASIGTLVTGIFAMLTNAAVTFDWQQFGWNIANGINNLFAELDGKTIAGGINSFVNGIFETLSTVIREVDWGEILSVIGSTLANLDWGSLAKIWLATRVAKFAKELGRLFSEGLQNVGEEFVTKGLKTLMEKMSTAFSVDGIFSGIGSKIATAFSGAIPAIGTAIAKVGTAIVTFIGGLPAAAIVAAAAAVAAIIAVICNWDKVKEFFTSTLPTWWNDTVIPWIDGLPEFFSELPDKIYEKIILVKDKFVDWATSVWEIATTKAQEIVDGIVKFFSELPEKIGYAIGFVLGKLASWGAEILEWITENIPQIIENVITFFSGLPGKIWDAIISAKDKVVEWAGNIWEYLSTKVPEIVSGVRDFFAELPGKIWDAIVSTADRIGEWCSNLYDKVVEEVPKITQKVIDFFKELPGKIFNIGKEIVSGFVNGIKDKWESARKKVGEFVGGVVKGFKDGFDVHSPSRVMQAIGENVAAGLRNGIDGNASDVLKVVDQLGANLKKSINQSLDDMELRTAQLMQSLKNEFDRTVGEANASASNIVNAFSGLHIPIPHLSVSWDNWSIGNLSFSVPNFDINWYANGGFPEAGELFLARESGPEMVGRMGNRNTVANNDQITKGIADAVEPAVYNGMMAALASTRGGSADTSGEKRVYMDGDRMIGWLIDENDAYKKRHGGKGFLD